MLPFQSQFQAGILHIFPLCSKEKVVGIYTGRIVAVMADQQPLGDRADPPLVCDPVCALGVFINLKEAIPARFWPCPFPAFVGRAPANVTQKSIHRILCPTVILTVIRAKPAAAPDAGHPRCLSGKCGEAVSADACYGISLATIFARGRTISAAAFANFTRPCGEDALTVLAGACYFSDSHLRRFLSRWLGPLMCSGT